MRTAFSQALKGGQAVAPATRPWYFVGPPTLAAGPVSKTNFSSHRGAFETRSRRNACQLVSTAAWKGRIFGFGLSWGRQSWLQAGFSPPPDSWRISRALQHDAFETRSRRNACPVCEWPVPCRRRPGKAACRHDCLPHRAADSCHDWSKPLRTSREPQRGSKNGRPRTLRRDWNPARFWLSQEPSCRIEPPIAHDPGAFPAN
jgi:hypothetical protein